MLTSCWRIATTPCCRLLALLDPPTLVLTSPQKDPTNKCTSRKNVRCDNSNNPENFVMSLALQLQYRATELLQSRNYDDENDDFLEPEPKLEKPIVKITQASGERFSTKVLYVAHSKLGVYVVKNSLELDKVVGSIVLPELPPPRQNKHASNACEIHTVASHAAEDVLVVVCQYNVSDDRCYAWTHALFERISAGVVCIVDDISLDACHRVHPPFNAESSVIYATSGDSVRTMLAQQLPQLPHRQALVSLASLSPLLLTGVGAALMNYCLLHKLSAMLLTQRASGDADITTATLLTREICALVATTALPSPSTSPSFVSPIAKCKKACTLWSSSHTLLYV